MNHHWTPLMIVDAAGNLLIVAGYLFIPFTVLPRIALTTGVRAAGVLFFLTCAFTHLGNAVRGGHHSLIMTINHVVQAAAVWLFVVGFARLVTHANRRLEAKRHRLVVDKPTTGPPGQSGPPPESRPPPFPDGMQP
jgi:hypothetical protein